MLRPALVPGHCRCDRARVWCDGHATPARWSPLGDLPGVRNTWPRAQARRACHLGLTTRKFSRGAAWCTSMPARRDMLFRGSRATLRIRGGSQNRDPQGPMPPKTRMPDSLRLTRHACLQPTQCGDSENHPIYTFVEGLAQEPWLGGFAPPPCALLFASGAMVGNGRAPPAARQGEP